RLQLQGAERISIEVQGPVSEILSKLRAMPGVVDVRKIADIDGRHRLEVEGELRKDIRSDLGRMSVQNGLGLYVLQSSTMSLEDIFLKLTTAEESEKQNA